MSFDVNKSMETLTELTNLLSEKKHQWLQNILTSALALFGILISLNDNSSEEQYIRLVFAFGCVLLLLGILCAGIGLYSSVTLIARTREKYLEEALESLKENRVVPPVSVAPSFFYTFVVRLSYIFLISSLILFAIYTVLRAL